MLLEDLKDAIEDEVLNLADRGLTTKDVEQIIGLILEHPKAFNSVSGIILSGNNIDNIPKNFHQLYDFMERRSFDFLEMDNNPFNRATMDQIIFALQCKNSAGAISIHIFHKDVVTREQCQIFIYNSLVERLAEMDPEKRMTAEKVIAHLTKEAKDLLHSYAIEVNENAEEEDADTKLACLTAKDVYLNPHLLPSQITVVMSSYYSASQAPGMKPRRL